MTAATDAEPVPSLSIMDRRRTLPAWLLRLAVGVTAGAVVAVVAVDGAPVGALIILGLVAASAVLVPASSAAGILGAGAAILLAVFSTETPVRPAVLAIVVLVHLLHVTSGLSAVVPPGARIHLAALRRPAVRFVGVQCTVLALAGLAALLPHSSTPVLVEVAALLGVTGLAALAAILLRGH